MTFHAKKRAKLRKNFDICKNFCNFALDFMILFTKFYIACLVLPK